MHSALRRSMIQGAPLALAGLLVAGAAQPRIANADTAPGKTTSPPDARWGSVSVELPASGTLFPAGDGAVIANSQCLICHSAGMVLTQPARTQEQWKETINKMRSAYGAPLPAEQVDPLATYLSRLSSGKAGSDIAQSNLAMAAQANSETAQGAVAADGAAIFAVRCAACHQPGGTGLPGVFPPLAGSNWVNGPDAAAVQILLHGVQGALTVNGIGYNGAMPTFGDQLSDAEIAKVLTYIRGQWGNKAGPVGAELVSAQRAASAAHAGPWNGDADLTKIK